MSKPLLITCSDGSGTCSSSPRVAWYDSSKTSSLAPRKYLRQTAMLFCLLLLKIEIPSIKFSELFRAFWILADGLTQRVTVV